MTRKITDKVFLLLVTVLMTYSCTSPKRAYLFTSFHEPATEGLRMLYSYDGYSWKDLDAVLLKPEVGSQKVMRDPSMMQGPDKTFHLVWTSSWRGDKGFGYASSKDLIHWSKERFIPVMDYEPTTVNVWAPELFYDGDSKQFIIVWASCIPVRFEKGMEEDSNNHRLYFTTTKDFERFSETKLFLDPGFSVIDAVIVKRDKNNYVLVLKDNTRPNRSIRVAFSDHVLGPYSKVSDPLTPNFTEGPALVKIKNDYLIYYDQYRDKIFGAMKTKDFKTFTDVTNEVNIPQGHKHGTIITVKRKFIEDLKKNIHSEQ